MATFSTFPASPMAPLTLAHQLPSMAPVRAAQIDRSMGWPSLSVVVPTLNEAENLPYVLTRIPTWVEEVILVDGYSTDDTITVARQVMPEIKVIYQEGRGKGAALRTGFKAASGAIIVMIDADGSTDPAEIPAFVGALLAGADFVKGSRFLQGGGTADMEALRRWGNWGLTTLSNFLFGAHFSDLCYGYNAFWTDVIRSLELDGDGFEIETMMNVRAVQAGYKVAEVPSFEAPRIFGESRLNTWRDGWRVLKCMLKEHSSDHQYRVTRGTLYSTEGIVATAAD